MVESEDMRRRHHHLWREHLGQEESSAELRALRRHNRTGRPLGNADFIRRLEQTTGRNLRPQKPGPRGLWKHRQGSQNE
jgi:putative transposase